jgi:hypothetical protein
MKPLGLTAGFQLVVPNRAQDAIWNAVEEAQDANMTVQEFISEAREAWEVRLKEHAATDDRAFAAALNQRAPL